MPPATPQLSGTGTVWGRSSAQFNTYFGAKADASFGCMQSPTLNSPQIFGPVNLTGPVTINGQPITAGAVPTVTTYGAKCNGTADDTTAFAQANAAGAIVVPGVCRIASNVVWTAPIFFSAGGSIQPDAGVTAMVEGPITASVDAQIFTGQGKVTTPVASFVSVAWWGGLAAVLAGTDAAPAMRQALGPNRTIYLPATPSQIASTTLASSSTTLTFAAVPSIVTAGMTVIDETTPTAIAPNTTVLSTTGTTTVLTQVASGVRSGDVIAFQLSYRIMSFDTNPFPLVMGSIGVNDSGYANQAISGRGAVVSVDNAHNNSNLMLFSHLTNFRISGVSFQGNTVGLPSNALPSGMILEQVNGCTISDISFSGNWGGSTHYPSPIRGDWLSDCELTRISMPAVSQGYDLAYLHATTIHHNTCVGADDADDGGASPSTCISVASDHTFVTNYPVEATFTTSDGSIYDNTISNFASGIFLRTGTWRSWGNRIYNNPGAASSPLPTADGNGYLITYDTSTCCNSIGDPVHLVSTGNHIQNNGATVGGAGLYVDCSLATNSDQCVVLSTDFYDGNRSDSTFAVSGSAAHLVASLKGSNFNAGAVGQAPNPGGDMQTVVLSKEILPNLNPALWGASGSAQTTTANCNGTTAVTLASAIDFQPGQGIRLDHCGTAVSVSTPTGLTVTPEGTTGSTTYSYQVATCDTHGGLSAPTAAVTITNGNANLTPVNNYNLISWTASGACWAIWRQVGGSGPYSFLTTTSTNSWSDQGAPAQPTLDWVPATAPAGALNDWLVTTVVTGATTASIVVANAATPTISGVTAAHDDTAALDGWLSYANAAATAVSCSASGQYRASAPLTALTAAGAEILATRGCAILGAGAATGSFGGYLVVNGPSASASTTLSADFVEGSNQATVASASGFSVGGYAWISGEAATIGAGQAPTYDQIYQILGISGSVLTLRSPSAVTQPHAAKNFTLSGTAVANGDVFTLTLTSASVKVAGAVCGSGCAITYTASASDPYGTEIFSNIVAQLATVLYNAAPQATAGGGAGCLAWPYGNTLRLWCPAALSVTWALATTGATTVTGATEAAPTVSAMALQAGNAVEGLTLDGTNFAGYNGNFGALAAYYLARPRFRDLRFVNWQSGGFLFGQSADPDVRGIEGVGCGDAFYSCAQITAVSNATLDHIHIRNSPGFATVLGGVWVKGRDITSQTSADRGCKLAEIAHFDFRDMVCDDAGETGLALTWGTYSGSITGVDAVGAGATGGWLGNSEGVWFDGACTRMVTIRDLRAANNQQSDINLYPCDQANYIDGAIVSKASNVNDYAPVGANLWTNLRTLQ